MEEMPLGFFTAFLLPFHIGGAAAVGVAIRKIALAGFGLRALVSNVPLLLWGSMFGGIPLLFGLSLEPRWFILLQIVLFAGTVIIVAVGYEWLRGLYSQPGMVVGSLGFAFLMVGLSVALALLTAGESDGLLIGLVFAGVGGALVLAGVWILLRSGSNL